jgi:hypothetical protein
MQGSKIFRFVVFEKNPTFSVRELLEELKKRVLYLT